MPQGSAGSPRRRRPAWRSWLTAAACVAIGSAVAAAAIPALGAATAARPVTYFACVTNRTGALKIVSASTRCRAGQHKISWNNIGPAGPPVMAKGYAQVTAPGVVLSSTLGTTILTLKLPLGDYVVNLTARFNELGGHPSDQVYCDLLQTEGKVSTVVVTASGALAFDSAANSGLMLPMTAGIKVTPKVTFTVSCSDDVSAAAVDEVSMTATPVSSLAP